MVSVEKFFSKSMTIYRSYIPKLMLVNYNQHLVSDISFSYKRIEMSFFNL